MSMNYKKNISYYFSTKTICNSLTLDLITFVIMLKNLLQEVADLEGDTAAQYKISQELEELEERANELDRRRTNNISSIR